MLNKLKVLLPIKFTTIQYKSVVLYNFTGAQKGARIFGTFELRGHKYIQYAEKIFPYYAYQKKYLEKRRVGLKEVW